MRSDLDEVSVNCAVQPNAVVEQWYKMVYIWRDKKDPNVIKFGEHSIVGVNLTEPYLVNDTKEYIRKDFNKQKHKYDLGDIEVLMVQDISNYADRKNKNTPGSHIDNHIAKECGLNAFKVGRGDIYKIGYEEAIKMINDEIYGVPKSNTYALTSYQEDAVNKAVAHYKAGNTDFLLDCFMRFGKGFTSYHICKRLNAKRVLMLTGSPKVYDSWVDALNHIDFPGWILIDSRTEKNVQFTTYSLGGTEVIFASFQGSKKEEKSRIEQVIGQEIDVVIIDEVSCYLSSRAVDFVKKLNAKYKLWVDGTPFKAYNSGMFNGITDTYRFTLMDALREKKQAEDLLKADKLLTDTQKRFTEFPYVQFLVSEYPKMPEALYNEQELNMRLLLSMGDNGPNYPTEVNGMLTCLSLQLRKSSREGLKYSINPSHIFAVIPAGKDDSGKISIAAAHTLEEAIEKHNIFKDFVPLIIIDNINPDDVNAHMEKHEKTIIITCDSLTRGTAFPKLDTIIFFKETCSAASFWQVVGRGLQPHEGKKSITVICMSLQLVVDMASEMVEYSINGNKTHNETMTELLSLMPIYVAGNGPKLRKLTINEVYTQLTISGSPRKSFRDAAMFSADIDTLILNNSDIFNSVPDFDDVDIDKEILYENDDKPGKNSKKSSKTNKEKNPKNFIKKTKEKLKLFMEYITTPLAASSLVDSFYIKSSKDLINISKYTVDNELQEGTYDVLQNLLKIGALNTTVLDRKISTYYEIVIADKITEQK